MKTYVHVTCINFDDKKIIKKFRLKHFIERSGELVELYKSIEAKKELCTDSEFLIIEQNVY